MSLEFDKSFGAVLRKYRERAGYTISDITNKLCVYKDMLGKCERGVSVVSLTIGLELAKIYNVELETMIKEAITSQYTDIGKDRRARDRIAYRALRKKLKLNQSEIAALIGLPRSDISDIERGNVTNDDKVNIYYSALDDLNEYAAMMTRDKK